MLKPKKEEEEEKHNIYKWRRQLFQQCNLCVLYRCTLKYTVSSFADDDDDDFTKTVFTIGMDRVLVYREQRVGL